MTTDKTHGPRFDAARAVSLSDEFAPWAGRPGVRVYLRPLGLADAAPGGLALAGGTLPFDRLELILRQESPSPSRSPTRTGPSLSPRRGEPSPLPRGEVGTAAAVPGEGAAPAHPSSDIVRAVADLDTLRRWAASRGLDAEIEDRLDELSRPRPPFAGLALDRPRLMGIVNVTPDSFSDGGDFADPRRAVAHGLALAEAGAEILDIGGESTRPGSAPVSQDEEIARIGPVIRDLANRGLTVSVDTRHAAVMQAALAAGARIVNDVTGLTGDPASLGVVARAGCPVVLMHIQGEPRTMQENPVYDDVLLDVFDWLEERVGACAAAGIPPGRIAVDPGIGFGKKSLDHNLPLLRGLSLLHGLGCAVLLGVSRKRFIGTLSGAADPKSRVAGSVAAGLYGVAQGVQILRVHDVAETRQALAVWSALQVGIEAEAGD
ncbi:dihydropteroate synthase [Inquilinus sp.]|uniref:dihydropteroate synthase n=1 Tax=Inquilinus sp. TaxID=1932117 RepID=UPI0031D5C410